LAGAGTTSTRRFRGRIVNRCPPLGRRDMSDEYPLVRSRWNAFAVTPTSSGVSRRRTSKVTSPDIRSSPANNRPNTLSGGVSRRSNVNSIGANVRRTSAVDLGCAERGAVPTR
jgi:hypothetical protein